MNYDHNPLLDTAQGRNANMKEINIHVKFDINFMSKILHKNKNNIKSIIRNKLLTWLVRLQLN